MSRLESGAGPVPLGFPEAREPAFGIGSEFEVATGGFVETWGMILAPSFYLSRVDVKVPDLDPPDYPAKFLSTPNAW